MKPLWKQRNFMLIWSGQLVSWIGTQVSGIALPLVVLALTGSPAQAGTIAAMRGVTYVIFAIPAGALIDRWDRKIVMITANLGSGFAMGSIALALSLKILTLPELYIISAIEGGFFVFANIARFTSIPLIVSQEQFPNAVAQINIADFLSLSLGPAIGGIIFQTLGAIFSFAIDSFSYFINTISVFFITASLKVQRENTNLLHKEIHEGLVWFWRQKNIRFLNSIYAGVTIVAVGLYLLIIIIAKNYHASSATIGVILGLGAVGGVLGSIVAPYLHKAFQFRTLLMITMVGLTLTFGLYFFAFNIVLLAIITACMNFIAPSFDVVISSFTTPLVPDEIRGRISSITRLTTFAAYSLGFFLMGVSIQFLGVTKTIATFFVFLIVLSLFVMTNKSLKKI